jgi:predicted RND superfamily exporter protein
MMWSRFVSLHARRPAWIGWFIVLLTAWATVGLRHVEFDDDPRAAFRVDGKEFATLESFYANFGEDDQDVYLVIDGDDLFAPRTMQALQAVYKSIKRLPEIESVVGLFDLRKPGPIPLMLVPLEDVDPQRLARAKYDTLAHPLAVGQFISADAKSMFIAARLAGRNVPVSELNSTLKKLRETANEHLAPAGLTLRLAGHPPTRVDLLRTLRSEVLKFTTLSAAISGLIAFVVFRRAAAVVIAVLGPVVGVVWTLGALGWLGVKIDPLSVVLPTLLFVVGFTDSVHLIADTQANRAAGMSPVDAACHGVEHLGPACLLTALTTVAGFGSLAIAQTECIGRFGLACAAGTIIMFAAVQLTVPFLARSRLGNGLGAGNRVPPTNALADFLRPAYERLLHWPRLVAMASVLVTAICFATSLQLQSDQRWTESLPESSETVQVTSQCDKLFGGSMFAYIVVEWPKSESLRSLRVRELIEKLHAVCREAPGLHGPISIVSILDALRRPNDSPTAAFKYLDRVPEQMLRRFLRDDLHKAVVAVHVPDIGSARLSPTFAAIDEQLAEMRAGYPGFDLHLTGTVVVAARNVHQMIADLAWSLTLASTLVFLLMTVLFRSLTLGLLSVVPNVFPQAISAALLVWSGQPLTMTSVMTFSLCFGLSVDDTVHFLTRYCRERETLEPRAAILRTFLAVGGVMITTSLVLVGGFLAMFVSQMPAIRVFSALCCLTLLAAIAGDLVMLPSLILCATRWQRRD